MDDLISRQALYEKMSEAEELAHQRVIDTRRTSPDGNINPVYAIYKTQLNERTRFKEMIYDEPSVERDYNLDEWCTDCKEYDKERHCCPRFNKVIRTALQEVQENQKNGEWIPCSERLPEEGKEVLISSDGGIYIAELEIFDGNVYWNETIEYRLVNGVSAWCPLPKPYKGKEE